MNPPIQLAPLSNQHLKEIFEWLHDPVLREQIDSSGIPQWETHLEYWKTRLADPKQKSFAILRNTQHVGCCGLTNIDLKEKKAELWVYFGSPNNRGQGQGSQAMRYLLDYAFNSLQLAQVYLRVVVSNERAIKFYEKLGFKKDNTQGSHKKIESVWLAISSKDYKRG